ncbi:ABC transporter permease [Rubellicoccus peritrichatus]|uniref:Transport permease protein n=1 Tax=Rubellicoccus peritrichatus TaxID=3080537 RepID=A0AAQ3LF56_9BACT|nr:ABC transporter permease [Puniceicoccus sp. CR14]WOO40804.1 ABC transporter permease [Puniceicoccus sp. CR14]
MSHSSPKQIIHIKPNQSWLRIDLKSIYEYRDLLWLLIRRDFVSKYKQTILGPSWAVIQPIMLSVVFSLIFGKVAQIPTDGAPPFLFYLCGLLLWQFFAGTVQTAGNSLQGNAAILGKVYFPRIIPPLATTISQLIPLAIQFCIFIGFYIYFSSQSTNSQLQISSSILLLPLLLLQVMIFGLGISLCFSALTAKYRDFQHALTFTIQLWLYATPVIYPASKLANYDWLLWINPMAMPISGMKMIFLGTDGFSLTSWGLSSLISVVILIIGLLWYQRTARTFIDTA